jgi:hypothetical protein
MNIGADWHAIDTAASGQRQKGQQSQLVGQCDQPLPVGSWRQGRGVPAYLHRLCLRYQRGKALAVWFITQARRLSRHAGRDLAKCLNSFMKTYLSPREPANRIARVRFIESLSTIFRQK